MTLPKSPGSLAAGDYVLATRWGDADWNDPWAVGFVAEIGKNFVRVASEDGKPIDGIGSRAFPFAIKITAEQGASIIREYVPREGTPFDAEKAAQIRAA